MSRPLSAWLVVLALLGCGGPGTPEGGGRPLLGTLERDRYEVVASASEPIVRLEVRPGDQVTRGQVLARLDATRLEARIEAAGAGVRRAEARVEELERGARVERREQALARIARAQSELEQALLDRERARTLASEGVQPQADLDAAQTRAETARAGLEGERAAFDELVSGATAEELRQARAELDAAVAQAAELGVDLERLTLRAPVAGRIDAVPYQAGELPGAGASLVVLLARDAPYARIYVPEPELTRFAVGASARIEADGLEAATGRKYLEGRVRFVSREASFTPHFSLSERDRHRLAFVAEVELSGEWAEAAQGLPTGLPVRVQVLAEGRVGKGSP